MNHAQRAEAPHRRAAVAEYPSVTDPEQAAALVRRFVALPPERRRVFLERLAERGIDFSLLPIPMGLAGDDPAPLSPVQQGLWFLAQLDPDSAAYHIAGGLRLRGPLDAAAVGRAFDALALRHTALRTRFQAVDGQPFQHIDPPGPVDIRYLDFSTTELSPTDHARQPFDLERGPLWRVALVRHADEDHELWLTLHHLIADGGSLNRLLEEFAELYAADREHRAARLPEPPIRYADYAAWQSAWLDAGELDRQLTYWTARLNDGQPTLELPLDRPRPAIPSDRGGRVAFRLEQDLGAGLAELARREGATLFMALLAGFQALLYRYTGQAGLRVGVAVATRGRPETETVMGYCVNTLVFRAEVDGRSGFRTLLARVKAATLDAQRHADVPFERLVEALQPERSLGRNPLFQVLYNHQRRDFAALGRRTGWRVEPVELDHGAAQFDLSLDTEEDAAGNIGGVFTYAADLFEASTIERMRGHFLHLLRAWVARPDQPLAELPLLTATESAQLWAWNAWERKHAPTPVHELIHRQAEARPAAPALVDGDLCLSYGELDARADRLAQALIRLGAGPEIAVALAVRRSAEMVVALLGILKSGAGYLPLDPEAPPERSRTLLEDAGVRLLVADAAVRPGLRLPPGVVVLELETGRVGAIPAGTSENDGPGYTPTLRIHPEQLAYLIYTSGSTGQPKAVAVAHGPLSLHCQAIAERYGMTPDDRALHFATLGFDAAVEQWIVPLIAGACLVVRGPELWSAEQAYTTLAEQGVTWFEMPPAYLAEVARWAVERGKTLPLRACSVGGEAVPRETLDLIRRAVGTAPIVNGYGPTETVITPLVWTAGPETPCPTAYAPIGTPVGERSAYVLDADLNLLPVGVAGELYIGGTGLARGYWRRPGLTAERFLPDPFGAAGARLYRTGDRARLLADGSVEYLGRTDHQVKLRGYRIELGEIEAGLLAHPAVTEAVVWVHGEGSAKRLLAYVVAGTGADELKGHLRGCLPEYMVPAQILRLDRLPRLPSGKLDRKALPSPEWTGQGAAFRSPATAAEQALATIWREVLGLERVGLDDNFFELGGDSIVSLRVVSRARQAGWAIAPKDVFLHQTVAALAAHADKLDPRPMGGSNANAAQGVVPLTPIQAAFFEEAIPNRQHWNLSLLLETRRALDLSALEAALRHLVGHHDALRLRYRAEGGAWVQRYAEASRSELLWLREAADAQEIEHIAQAAQRSLDLETGPVLRAVHIAVADGSYRLLLVAHHLVVDGVSWRILLADLQAAYERPTEPLPARTCAFKTWAERLRDEAASPALRAELPYWEAQRAGPTPYLPQDYPGPRGCFAEAETHRLRLGREDTQRLMQAAPLAYRARIDDLLLTALARTLCQWSGQPELLVELESHGREDRSGDVDLSHSVGWYTAAYPVRLRPAADLSRAIPAIKEQLRQVPGGGQGYGILRYLTAPDIRDQLHAGPRPLVSFNYFGQLREDESWFFPARESAGDDHDPAAPLPSLLEINGQIYGGELELRWRYNRTLYRATTLAVLVEKYRRELLDLIEHCLGGVRGATPSDFPLARLDQDRLDALPIAPGRLEDLYPLSPMQQGLLFHSLYALEQQTYVNQLAVDIEGLGPERFAAAWREAMRRHPILRSGFLWRGAETPLQAVHVQVELPLQILDWRGEATPERLAGLRAAEHARGFDLANPPLLRLVLVRVDEDRHHLIWTSHHLLLDGWSTSLLLGEVIGCYADPTARRSAAPPFRDYIAWLEQKDSAAGEPFWRDRLACLEEPTQLAEALPAPVAPAAGVEHLRLGLDSATTATVRRGGESQRVTLNTLVQAAWALLLWRYTGQATVAFGVTVAGRPAELPGAERMLGLFINTLPLVQTPRSGQAAGAWLRALQADNLALREHEYLPLHAIQRWHGLGARPGSGQALFDTLLVFENYPVDQALREVGGRLRFGVPLHIDTTHYPLTLNITLGDNLGLAFGYDPARFDAARVGRISRHFERLLVELATHPERPLGGLCLLGAAERAQLAGWNATARHYPDPAPIHQRIRRQAEARPEAPALLWGSEVVAYGELERRANRLAHRLIRLGAGPDTLVGVALERRPELVVALLAVLKAGAAYVPLDLDYPAERLAYMLADSGVGIVLAGGGASVASFVGSGQGDAPAPRVLDLDAPDLSAEPDTAPDAPVHPEQLAYVIYTSGSTGRPKGAGNTHAALRNRLDWMQAAYHLGPDDTVLHKTPCGFDVSVWEFFWPLLAGARLAIAPPGAHRDPARLAGLIREHRVTTLHFVPSMLAEFAAHADDRPYPSLKRIVCSGEALPAELRDRAFQRFPGVDLHNLYGPTEAAIDVTHWTCRPADGPSVPIGHPIANLALHILDPDLNPVPPGVAGELYIGGVGLARGYHGRPGLTAERFVPDPAGPGTRLYRTGDRARHRADGAIEYLGRLDHQVKLRGVRIEPGEIEARLLAQPGVSEAVVLLADAPGGPRLVAYAAAAGTDADTLAAALRRQLPEAMLPSRILVLDRLPKTPNGKLDRKALPGPEWAGREYLPPATDTERRLAAIWQELLGVGRVGRSDRFFDLGGHSLLAMRLAGQIKQTLDVELSVRQIFEHSELTDLAREIDHLGSGPVSTDPDHALADALAELSQLTPEALASLLTAEHP
ncbi:non-ribosomal peptide synthase domain TIGR01720/amino acid adenylation domain-containing protein [Methylomagnum ishizawai]|uniref:Non-ribosomal peptide synthase domain TIGR01720/amino acid adenylation domain-containing protein n=1 Tax=Methylomagnum ishizawai TaxID=1760988 RepID=A0A1Y6D3E4_9GAMM|nr:non-ribosomal peptide synthetase [Methylomagnum ishizawai]SMF97468.1 non-ribosomal peptide synthase domain TIGR01720/amino acid adenylation domain-containing protein [Methylomagnum ishizawai]